MPNVGLTHDPKVKSHILYGLSQPGAPVFYLKYMFSQSLSLRLY